MAAGERSAGGERPREAVVLHFRAQVTREPDGRYKAVTGEFPSIAAHGDSAEQAQAALEASILRHLAASSSVTLEAVYEEPLAMVPYASAVFQDQLWLATSLDAVLVTNTGKSDGWKRLPVSQQPTENFSVFEGEKTEEVFDPGEYMTQIYSLTVAKAPAEVPTIFAGTNLKGLVYANTGTEEWLPAFSTGEQRVHALAGFGGKLYAGTSSPAKLYRWDGRKAEQVYQSRQMGITALAAYAGALYAGTYPDGHILRSEDGELWEVVCDTKQRLVNQFCAAPDALYAALSNTTGGSIFRSVDGRLWQRCFASERDVNVYGLTSFGGRLYAGTGESGRLYASRDGLHWEPVGQLPEAGLRTLASFHGRLYIGCEQRGVVYRSASTEAAPPAIKDVKVTVASSSRAVLEWATDSPCEHTIQYGEGPARTVTASNATMAKRHRAALDGLRAGVKYTFLITVRNAEGAQDTYLDDKGFETSVMPAPVLVSETHPEEDKWYPAKSAYVTWEGVPGAAQYAVQLAQQRIVQLTSNDPQIQTPAYAFSIPADGVWWLAVAAVDDAGNVGQVSLRCVRVDTAAPIPALMSDTHPDPSKWYSSQLVEMEVRGNDPMSGVAGYLYAVGRLGESWEGLAFQDAPAARWDLPSLPEGIWEIYVRLRDGAGNTSQPASHRIQVDASPPKVEVDPLPLMSPAGELELRWKAADERSGVAKVRVQQKEGEGEWQTVYEGRGSSVMVKGEDGRRMFYRVVAEDRAGGSAVAEAVQPVLFDGSPPLPVTGVEVVSQPGGDILVKWAPTRDELTEVACYHVYRNLSEGRGGMKVGTVKSGILEFVDEGLGLAHGTRYFYWVAPEDAAGNVQEEGAWAGAVCDKEAAPPVLRSATHPAGQWTSSVDAVVEWDAPQDDSGVKEYLWRLDRNPASSLVRGVDNQTPEPSLKLARLMDGLWYVHVATVDGAGNVSPPAHYLLRVATRQPHARLKPLPPLMNSRTVKLEWEREEGVVAVGVGTRMGGAREWTVLADRVGGNVGEAVVEGEGVYEFSIRALDTMDRWGVWEDGQVTLVDTTPPLEVPSVTAKSRPQGLIRVEWEPSWDELSGLTSYRVFRTRAGQDKWDLLVEVPGTEDPILEDECRGVEEGTRFAYRVWPVDAAGNMLNAGPVAEAVCDRSAPPPVLKCLSHPDPGRFYPSRRLKVAWEVPSDPTGIEGLVIEMNATPGTQPNPDSLALRTDPEFTVDLPEDGRWYLHARCVDGAGNASPTVHLSVLVDTRAETPVTAFAQDPFLEWESTGGVSVVVKEPADPSGIAGFLWVLDQYPETVPDRASSTRVQGELLKVKPETAGVWHLHVSAEDGAGNISAPSHLVLHLTTGLPMPRILKCSHPEGLWSRKRQFEASWDPVEGAGVSYLCWLDPERREEPPGNATKLTAPEVQLQMEEGIRFFHVCAADDRGRRSPAMAYQVRVDATAPELKITSPSHPAGKWSAKTRVQYAMEVADSHSGIARVEIALVAAGSRPDAWELALGTEGEREVPTEGIWTLWARAVDLAGNHSDEASWEVRVDSQASPPTISSYTHPEGLWVGRSDAEVLLTPNEEVSGVAEYMLYLAAPGEELPAAPPPNAARTTEEVVGLRIPGEGRWTLLAWSRDVAGNLSAASRYVMMVDASARAPSGFIVEPTGEGGWIRSPDLYAYWRVAEEISGDPWGYVWCLDHSPKNPPTLESGTFAAEPALFLGNLDDGIWYLHVRTLDAAGNLSPDAAHIKIPVDTNPPSLEVSCPQAQEGRWVRGRHVQLHVAGTDEVSGYVGCFWALSRTTDPEPDVSAGSWREEPDWSVDMPGDGEWRITVAGMDGAGNLSAPVAFTVGVDSEAFPPVSLASPTHLVPGTWYPSREVSLMWDAPADLSGVKGYRWKMAANPAELGEPAGWRDQAKRGMSVALPADGKWVIGVATEDMVGNFSAPALLAVCADTYSEKPVLVCPSHPDSGVWYADTEVRLEFSAGDEVSGPAHILVGASQSENTPTNMEAYEGGAASFSLGMGVWFIHAVAVDRAGNRSAPVVHKLMIDPTVKPPVVICESHPDPERWYQNTDIRFSITPAAGTPARKYMVSFDMEPRAQPTREGGKLADAGPFRLSADHSGEWYLHVAPATDGKSGMTEAAHCRVRVDVGVPPSPEVVSPTHPRFPRRVRTRDAVFEWVPPQDTSGIKSYAYTISRPSMLGMKRERAGKLQEPKVTIGGLDQGVWDFVVTAADGADNVGAPGKYTMVIADSQDVCVAVRSESWRIGIGDLAVELRGGEKSLRKGRTEANGESWFRDLPYGSFTAVVGLEKLPAPLVFEDIPVEEGEPFMRLEVTLAGCAWMVTRDRLLLWTPKAWKDGGRLEVLNERGKAVVARAFAELAGRGSVVECPLPPDLAEGSIRLVGGPLNRLQWPPLSFSRQF